MVENSINRKAVLLATLGSEPQVITATLDLLAKQKIAVHAVHILHTVSSFPSISGAVETLREEFNKPQYINKLNIEFVPLHNGLGAPLEDIETLAEVKSAFRMIYQQLRMSKKEGCTVHLAISGGRKILSIFGMVAAQLLFDEDDRLWYLYSSGDFLSSKRLHPQANDVVSLIPVPVILWSQISPVFAELSEIEDPFHAVNQIKALRLNEQVDQARSFVLGSLSPAELRVVEVLVRDGSSDQEIADHLSLSPRTVEQHLRSAYSKAADHWELETITRTQLVSLLQLYFSTRLREIPHDRPG